MKSPRRSTVWLRGAPPQDLARISTEFSGAITTPVCFSYSLGGVTTMPRGIHTSLCEVFLV